jgi:hypothetical protein
MKVFHCDHCGNLVFFENVRCVRCDHTLAYLPDLGIVGSLEPAGKGTWRCPSALAADRTYRLCDNYIRENVCNWAVCEGDSATLCRSCRLTRAIPDLSRPEHKEAWYRLEVAKRRLLYTLFDLSLPVPSLAEDPHRGLAFDFLADPDDPSAPRVLTGHNAGVITINVAEVDDAERERRKKELGEPYRTLLGHFRHEIGHYYWTRLVDDTRKNPYRGIFGDERADYAKALERHYREGAPADWQDHFVSAYASAHPWEDWAETWAHYVHMTDTLETAIECGLSLRPSRADEPSLKRDRSNPVRSPFDRMIDDWFSVTYLMNNLNRGLGLADAYPFVLASPAIEKLRFVHQTIVAAAAG